MNSGTTQLTTVSQSGSPGPEQRVRALAGRPLRIALVERCGDNRSRYSPLAIMCLRAALDDDEQVRATGACVELLSFTMSDSIAYMISAIVDANPDILGFSCQGWTFVDFMAVAASIRQYRSETLIIVGGNHVTGRGSQILSRYPAIDLVFHGEGEIAFVEAVQNIYQGVAPLSSYRAISYRGPSDVVTTEAAPRVRDLCELPSPYATAPERTLGEIDVALIETNRGCPYHCAFCFWGGAVGQKIGRGHVDRFRDELRVIVENKIDAVWICDANFGILQEDVEIARLLVASYREHGYPRTVQATWAKNNVRRVREIIEILRDGGLHNEVWLPLQTMSSRSLELADRNTKGRQELLDLALHLAGEGMWVGCELIFGLPGETLEDFFAGYDSLFPRFKRTLIHPLVVLPSTTYAERREELGLVTFRPGAIDYELVYQHSTLSVDDNREGLSRMLSEWLLVFSGFARETVRAIVASSPLTATQCLCRFRDFVFHDSSSTAKRLRHCYERVWDEVFFDLQLKGILRGIVLDDMDAASRFLAQFLDTLGLSARARELIRSFADYDRLHMPRTDLTGAPELVVSEHEFPFNVDSSARELLVGRWFDTDGAIPHEPVTIVMEHLAGFREHAYRDNIDIGGRWDGRVVNVRKGTSITHAC